MTELTPENGHYGDGFGGSLALSAAGDTLVVGASYESSAATGVNGDENNTQAMLAGAAYVFRSSGDSWARVAYLKASNTEQLDEFGTVAISGDGNTVAVGAIGESSNATGVDGDQSNNLATQSGAVYVFTTDGTTWRQDAYLKASNTNAQDAFGYALALSSDGTTLAVGAPEEDTAATGIDGSQGGRGQPESGAVYLFRRTQAGWAQTAYVKASNTHATAHFGSSVSLSALGDHARGRRALRAERWQQPPRHVAGGCRRRVPVRVRWQRVVATPVSQGRSSGRDGDRLRQRGERSSRAMARSSPSATTGDDSGATDSGAVATFAETFGLWQPLVVLKAPTPATGDAFGTPAVSSDGAYVLVGASRTNANTGTTYVFY